MRAIILLVSSPPFSVEFSDGPTGSGVDASTFRAFLRQSEVTDEFEVDEGTATSDTLLLEDGLNSARFEVADRAGNIASLGITVRLDSFPPALRLVSPSPGSIVSAPVLELVLEVVESGSGLDASSLIVLVDETDATSAASLSGSQILVVLQDPLLDGVHTLDVQLADEAGLQSNFSGVIIVDATPPILEITDPDTSENYSALDTFTIRGKVIDLTESSVTINGQPAGVSFGEFSGTLRLPEGHQDVEIRAVDAVGNVTTRTITVIVDTVAPVLTLTGSSPIITTQNPLFLTGTLLESTPTTITVGGIEPEVELLLPASVGVFELPVPLPANGAVSLSISAVDAAGNESLPHLVSVIHDDTPPSSPVPFSRAIQTDRPTVAICGIAEEGSQVIVSGGVSTVTTATSSRLGVFSAVVPVHSNAEQVLSLVTRDQAGNPSPPALVSVQHGNAIPEQRFPRLTVVSGDAQRGIVGTDLIDPLVVIATDPEGDPMAGEAIRFSVIRGSGKVDGLQSRPGAGS